MKIGYLVSLDALRLMIFTLAQVLIAISNAILMKRLEKFSKITDHLKVSVLIPARNEELTIKLCLESILQQDYKNFEVLVLNDNSTDKTAEILATIKSEKLKVLEGENLPSDWNGKAWAAHQLAKQASGELLLFSDADTEYHRETLSYAVGVMQKTNADLLTIINHNKVKSFGEKITVPFGTWSILTLLPLSIAYLWRKNQALAAGNGKFLLFTKDCYHKIGGHEAVKDNAIEDVALVKLLKANGYKWRIFDGTNLLSARMYHNFDEALRGFSKNYFALFGYKILIALFVWLWMGIITFAPLMRIVYGLVQGAYQPTFFYSVISVLATCLLWIILSIKLKYPWYLFLLYPLIIGVSIFIGLRSMVYTIAHKTSWKDRQLRHRKIRWL